MQFDVYDNPSPKTKRYYPYLVDIQNPYISDIATRIVIPLGKLQDFNGQSLKGLTPEIEYGGSKYLLLTPQMSSIPAKALKNPIGSLSHIRDDIISAVDFAITGIKSG